MTDDIRPTALTIAGSDSGGGAGIQADIRVFQRLGVHATTAITAVTAQNLQSVRGVTGLNPEQVQRQVDAVLDGFDVRAIKTGMLWSRQLVLLTADIAQSSDIPVVVDPVMVATSGARLLSEDAIDAYRTRLLPTAALMTPNLDEAAILLERDPITSRQLFSTAKALSERFACAVLLKGGHLNGDPIDVLCHPDGVSAWTHRRVNNVDTHGTGCMLSAAIASKLALGENLATACEHALAFVHDALTYAHQLSTDTTLAGIESAHVQSAHLQRVPTPEEP